MQRSISRVKIFEINENIILAIWSAPRLVGYHQPDINKVLENLVFLHLLAAGYAVTVGQQKAGEIDFVCENGQRLYMSKWLI